MEYRNIIFLAAFAGVTTDAFAKTQYVVERPMPVEATRNNFHEGNFFAIKSFDNSEYFAYLVKGGKTKEFVGSSIEQIASSSSGSSAIILNQKFNGEHDGVLNYCDTESGYQNNIDIDGWESHYSSNGAWLRYVDKVTDKSGNDRYVGFFHAETNACYPSGARNAGNPDLEHVRMSIGIASRGKNQSSYTSNPSPLFTINYDPFLDTPDGSHTEPAAENILPGSLKNTMGLAQVSLTRTDEYYYLFSGVNNGSISVSRFSLGSPQYENGQTSWWALADNPYFAWQKYCKGERWVPMEGNTAGNCIDGEFATIAPLEMANGLTFRPGVSPAFDKNQASGGTSGKLLLVSPDSLFGLTLAESNGNIDDINYDPNSDLSFIGDPLIPYHGRSPRDDNFVRVADHYGNPSLVAINGGNIINNDSFYLFYRYNRNGFRLNYSTNFYRTIKKIDVADYQPEVKIALNRYSKNNDKWDTTKDPYSISTYGDSTNSPTGIEYDFERTIAYLWTKKVANRRMRLLCDAKHDSGDRWVRYKDYGTSVELDADDINNATKRIKDSSPYQPYCYDKTKESDERILGWVIHPEDRETVFSDFEDSELVKLARCSKRPVNGAMINDRWTRYYSASTADSVITSDERQCLVLGYALK